MEETGGLVFMFSRGKVPKNNKGHFCRTIMKEKLGIYLREVSDIGIKKYVTKIIVCLEW